MVKQFLGKKRHRNFEARNDRLPTGASAKQRGNGEAKSNDRKQGDCVQWQAEGKCSKGDLCSCKHDVSEGGKDKNERDTRSSSPAPQSPRSSGGKKHFSRQNRQRHQSLWKEVPETVPGVPQGDLHGSIEMTIDILPYVKSTKQKKAAVMTTNACFLHAEKSRHLNEKSKKEGKTGQGYLAKVRNVKKLG